MIAPLVHVFGRSYHEFGILNSGVKRAEATNLGSIPSALLGSLLQQSAHPRKLFLFEDMLGELCYAARDPRTDRPAMHIHPGRLSAIAPNGELHGRIDRPCRLPTAHDHEQLCSQWIDLALIRPAGILEEGLAGEVIFKCDEDGVHRSITLLGVSNMGLVLLPAPGMHGQQFFDWHFPPEPIQRIDSGELVFRDRRTDSTDPALLSDPSRRRSSGFRAMYGLTKNPHEQEGQGLMSRPSLRGVAQGFVFEQDWAWRDINGIRVAVPAVRRSPPNQDADLINRWLAARMTEG